MPSNLVVAITGASAGIGRATALRLAREGLAVVMARGLVLLNALAPSLCDRIVRKWGREPVTA